MQRVKSLGIISCFICIISLALTGCVIFPLPEHGLPWGRGKIMESDQAFLVKGETTREEVLLQFGEPDVTIIGEAILVYDWGVIAGGWVSLNTGGDIPAHYYLFLEFNPDGTLRRFKRGSEWHRYQNVKALKKWIIQDENDTEK